MKLTESQFTEAVYRHYYGETLTSIAKDFGISQSALSQLKHRRSADWQRRSDQIVASEIAKLQNQPALDAQTRHRLTVLLQLVIKCRSRKKILKRLCEESNCTPAEAESYIDTFESLLPFKLQN